jgi:ribosomal-protein-alanine N-acetyltransferase
MGNINFTPFPMLTTEHLVLRQITNEDLNEFFILKSDERLLKGYNGRAKTYEEARRFLQRINDEISSNEWIDWGITLKDENKLIGSICFWNINEEQSKAEIGYELMFDCQGKGIMSEAVKTVIKYGFENMKLDLIEALPYYDNTKSIKLLERNGFTRSGSFKEDDSAKEMIIYEYRKKWGYQ